MVARIMIPIILAIMLSDLYIDMHYWRHHHGYRWWKRLLWWLPSMGMLVYTIALGTIRNFVPDDLRWVNLYMLLVGIVVYPKAVFSLFSVLGRLTRHYITHSHRNWGTPVATVIIVISLFMIGYGSTRGFRVLKVKHITVTFDDLPPAFNGYRIVHFSDAHVGTFTGSLRHLLVRDIDSINAQHPDLIAFTGDLQNIRPREIKPVVPILRRLQARDGVVSVLGNHDYAEYVKVPSAQKQSNCRSTIRLEQRCGWRLLNNAHEVIRRGNDSLVIVGEQNLELPDSANLPRAMQGVGSKAFAIVLQHNPKGWDEHIRRDARARLTLSGHTHGGQLSVFGLRATQIAYREDYGIYRKGRQYLYVTSGIGGLIPFRFGISPEIAVITLRRSTAPR